MTVTTNNLPPFCVGLGFDIHPFVKNRPLILGGVNIPHNLGLGGHSDADALCHAITDALLGAAGLGDIGGHFPDTSPDYKNADSSWLLGKVRQKIYHAGFVIGNIDANIITERPKLAPYIPKMIECLAEVLNISTAQINLKGKTNEMMDAVGAGRALSVQAIVLLYRS